MYDPRISALALQDPEAAAIERRRMLAAMLMQQGQQNQKLTHPLQVVGNLANTAVSALLMRKADEEGKALADQQRSEVRSFFQPGQAAPSPTPPADAAPAGPMTAPPPGPVQQENLPPSGDIAARVLYGEAANQGPEGLAAVAHVIRNRANLTGLSPDEVVQKPGQFEPWGNPQSRERLLALKPEQYAQAKAVMDDVMAGRAPDPTGGATNFLNPDLQQRLGRPLPDWAPPDQGQRIGQHVFYSYPGDFKRTTPAQVGPSPQIAANSPPPSGAASSGESFPKPQQTLPGTMPTAPQPGSADMPVPGLPGMTLGALTTRVMEGLGSENPRIRAQAEKYMPLLTHFRQQAQPGGTVNINGPQGPGVYERQPNGGLRFLGGIPETALLPADVEAQRRRLAEAAKPTTTIMNDRSFGDRISENAANEVKDARGSARTGADAIRTANRIEQLLNSDVIVGAGADMRLGFERALSTVGLIDGRRVTNTEQLMAELARNVLPLVESLKGPTSDRDIEFLRQAANGQITFSKDTIARASQLARDYGARSIENYNSLVEPIQSDEKIPPAARNVYRPVGIPTVEPLPPGITNRRAAPSSVPIPGSGASAEPPATPSRPVAVRTPEEARRLPSGTQILLPDGTLGRVP